MLNTGLIIAIGVVAIYVLFGPLVLLGIYMFIDHLAEGNRPWPDQTKTATEKKDPAIWNLSDTRRFREELRAKRTVFSDARRQK